ncbi:MAG: Na+/H+ antiporter NhaC [Acidobacteria bacterium]|nr:Na+/H+ antiporter NhaC [Acidobacteriota bacterium]
MDRPPAHMLRPATLAQAMVPVGLLMGLLAGSVALFGDASSSGPNQIALILAAGAGAVVGLRNGHSWPAIERGIVQGISLSMGALLILLAVGSLIGTWILAGTVPTMIYYGLWLLAPSIFYAAACLICALVSLATGSSWTTAGTIGIALIGIATAQGLHLGVAAGAIISGAYFGDKMSPLSDTTNLAPAVAGTDLFSHINHMVWTTAPSFLVALVLFGVAGFVVPTPGATDDLAVILAALEREFVIGPHMLMPVALVVTLVARRMPAFPALLIGALSGAVWATLFQSEAVVTFVGDPELSRPVALIKGCWVALFDGFVLDSGTVALDVLLSRGGMSSMLSTVWLILSAMMFGAVMETTGLLEAIASRILRSVHSTGSLITATLLTAAGTNVLASDQYISIILPGRMFRAEYRRRGLDPKNLSRALEDAGTLTSVLVPWNTCGAYMAGTLGVATLAYAPFCFFNLINPCVAALYGWTNISVAPLLSDDEPDEVA